MSALGPAVNSLQSSLTLLNSSISILDEGVADFPRICKVLQRQRHFELLPETNLCAAQQSLVDEIAPAIEQLISTAEAYVDQLRRREESLKARYELIEGRMSDNKRSSNIADSIQNPRKSVISQSDKPDDIRALDAKRLQQKKERLQYAITRLELQSQQKQRELRKSMAFARD